MKIKPIIDVVTIAGATLALTGCDNIERALTGAQQTPTERIAAAQTLPLVLVAPAPAVVEAPVVIEAPKPPCVPVFRVSYCDDNGNSVEF